MGIDGYISKQFSNPKGIGGKLVSLVMNRQNHPLYEETLRLLKPCETEKILDIGCGNGYVLNMLANRYNCISAGIDTSRSAIKEASGRCRKYIKNGKMSFGCQNASDMSFAESSFDKAYTINTIYFWESLSVTMAEIGRVLKKGGLFINTFYTDEALDKFSHTQFGYKRFALEKLVRVGNETGFDVNIVPILNGSAYCLLYSKTNP